MEEDESRAGLESRPATAHQVDDVEVSNSFEDAEITPSNESLDRADDSSLAESHTTQPETTMAAAPNPAALRPENIPSLPPPTSAIDSSYADSPTLEDGTQADLLAEQAVREHLQDVESSFATPLSPLPTITTEGADDTYLFDSPSKKRPVQQLPSPQLSSQSQDVSDVSSPSPDAPQAGQGPAPAASTHDWTNELSLPEIKREEDRSSSVGNTTSQLEKMSSSPTAAAVARTLSRSRSRSRTSERAARVKDESFGPNNVSHSNGLGVSDSHLYSNSFSAATDDASEVGHDASEPSQNRPSQDARDTPGYGSKNAERPKYLRSRNVSQRSSVSSSHTNPDSQDDNDSEVTVAQGGLGTDYALQSGGAVPAIGMSRSMSNLLSRSISLGSMASGFDDFNDSSHRSLDRLEPLEEADKGPAFRRTNGRSRAQHDDVTQTPKAKQGSMTAPTDTVIARHVRNVHVPESLAKEYKTKGGLSTPTQRKTSDYSMGGTTATGTQSSRHGRNLTLKEQSSTIERLSKENFDLKLKVMFLSDRLDKLSEEGVKEMISENVELKTGLAVLQRDNKALRRRVKELEKQLKDEDERPSTAISGTSSNGTFDTEAMREREEELIYLRERIEEYESETERLREDNFHKEAEKRRMVDIIKGLGDKAMANDMSKPGTQDETDVWKDLLEQETARREQADDDNRRLRDENFRMKQEMNHIQGGGHGGAGSAGSLHHTTNIYNITKKRERPTSGSPSRPVTALSGEDGGSVGISAASTLVDELRRESEQLRHENAELRREVGAQTSMLTSRNREKERLYQEIEDLKMAQRRGGAALSTVDSLLERSASRAGAHERSASRNSGRTRQTDFMDEAEREELENKLNELRDRNNEVKLQNQDLQRELDTCMEDFETAAEGKRQAEETVANLQDDLEQATNDLMTLQNERDDALREAAELENEFDTLRREAQDEIEALEADADARNDELQRVQLDLQDRSENFDALQEEMRKMSEAVVRLEDDQANKLRKIQQLESELGEANRELEELEAKLLEANDKVSRLGVQQENSQGEIAFLREEQEGDKIRIGDLEAALANAEQSLKEERENVKETEQRLAEEREQREMVANREKEEVQQAFNNLNRDLSTAKDDGRRLRKNLQSKEVELTEWKERLNEFEDNLREAVGDLNGTRSSLLKSITQLQRELDNTVREFDRTKASVLEKDRIIKQRDALLETHSLEARKVQESLDKERIALRNTRNQFETFQKTHQHVSRTVTGQETRISELETAKAQAQKRLIHIESTLKEQLNERNNLLLVLWSRLSSLCGTDWAHGNSLINGRALPSLEAVATMLPGFSKNLLAAIKTIESMVGGFQSRIKGVENDLWKEYQSLENNLEVRSKKLERLEALVRNGVAAGTLGYGGQGDRSERMRRLEDAYRQLKVENATLRTANDVRARAAYASANDASAAVPEGGSPSPNVPTGPRDRSRPKTSRNVSTATSGIPLSTSRTNTMTRPGTNAELQVAVPDREGSDRSDSRQSGGSGGTLDVKWIYRLRDLEYKLKTEREGRNMDRSEARQRIAGVEDENRTLRGQVERMRRVRGDDAG